MRKIQVTLRDALAFWDDNFSAYVPNSSESSVNTAVFEVPDDWIEGEQFIEAKKDRVYAYLYGPTWLAGNGDGSRYTVLECNVVVLSPSDPTPAKGAITA